MKKGMIFVLLMVLAIGLNSCSKDNDDAPFLGAKVTITVKNIAGVPQKNTTVYMYKDKEVASTTKPSDAQKQIVTNENGVAELNLNLTELNILESQTSLYFAVFYTLGDLSVPAVSEGITVKRGDSKNITLTILL